MYPTRSEPYLGPDEHLRNGTQPGGVLRAVFLRFVSHYAPPGRQPATVGLVGAIDAASLSLASAGLVCPAPFGHFSPRAFPVPSSFV
ncbi:hypothetical protein HYQ44_014216 [Verticillium longisporum]|nr:hypothetical protein HYQ44_014216 [Verticillium longisporum]